MQDASLFEHYLVCSQKFNQAAIKVLNRQGIRTSAGLRTAVIRDLGRSKREILIKPLPQSWNARLRRAPMLAWATLSLAGLELNARLSFKARMTRLVRGGYVSRTWADGPSRRWLYALTPESKATVKTFVRRHLMYV